MPTRSPRRSGRSAIADEADIAGALSPLARLALAYAPAAARDDWLTLLALDERLGGVVRTAREPMLAQLKLAWWRDRLSADPGGWPKGEPLLARLAGWREPAGLLPLIDGWEALLAEPPLDAVALDAFAGGRAGALSGFARQLGAGEASAEPWVRSWSLAEVGLYRSAGEAGVIGALLAAQPQPAEPLVRALRPLVVLERVTRRALDRGGAEALYRPGAWFAAVRAGLLGR
jgi:phytoene synthase